MTVRVVRLGTPRVPGEGVRIGTVRRPPRGVPKARYARDNWYDLWMPLLAPSPDTVKLALSAQSGRLSALRAEDEAYFANQLVDQVRWRSWAWSGARWSG